MKKPISTRKTAAKKEPSAPKKKVAAKKSVTKTTAPKKPSGKSILKQQDEGVELAKQVAQGMFEKKAQEIRILDMRGVAGASSDFFVISHATSDKQVEAIADSAEEYVFKHHHIRPAHREGYENLEWILLDYFDVVAHIFKEDKREFYAIEELWGDAKEVAFKGK